MIQELNELRRRLQSLYRADEKSCVRYLVEKVELSTDSKNRIYNIAKQIIERIKHNKLDIIDSFLQQYSLSSDEGVALMCLAESLLRIPDDHTVDELIKDKIVNQEWSKHLGSSASLFVNASTWSLVIGSSILKTEEKDSKFYHIISKLLKNLGEPIIRKAVKHAVLMLGKHFIIGESIEQVLQYVTPDQNLYSFDVLGETSEEYFNTCMYSVKTIGEARNSSDDCFKSNGISIILSALHPRYEFSQFDHIADEVLGKILALCREAKKYNISLCIGAEEAEKLEMSLILFEKLRLDESLSQWNGLGLTVQSYQKRALHILDFIEDVAVRSKHKVMVRLIKGAQWNSEIKRAQELGMINYPVFTRKSYTDVSYLACAQKLLSKASHFYPCFATHNAYTFATIMEIADKNHPGFEFQRLYGMCKDMYDYVMSELATNISCRICAPVGTHGNLLPYLIKRLFDDRSFISHDVDLLIEDPLEKSKSFNYEPHPNVPLPQDIFGSDRKNALGIDMSDLVTVTQFFDEMKNFANKKWQIGPIIDGQLLLDNAKFYKAVNPADLRNVVGEISDATDEQVLNALSIARSAFSQWQDISVKERAKFLEKAADLLEENIKELIYVLIIESGKTIPNAISDIRKTINFLRYYAVIAKNKLNDVEKLPGMVGENSFIEFGGRGVFLCISSLPSAVVDFIKQIAAALATGNVVLVKPSKYVPIIVYEVVKILHEAGIPHDVLHFIPGNVDTIYDKVEGIVFTGSLQTVRIINERLIGSGIPVIAETDGLNAMVVDSSALMEQVTTDVLSSAFYSRGQNCSVLFIQNDIAEKQIKMICDAVEGLRIGNPIELSTDIGPVVNKISMDMLVQYTKKMSEDAHSTLLSKLPVNMDGYFFPPYIYEIEKISQLKQEVFGPVLHIIRFDKAQLHEVINDINNTKCNAFSLHSYIQSRVNMISKRIFTNHIYINRSIDSKVEADGINYLKYFFQEKTITTIFDT
nr:bifunctional proline dehydrogenase/L-glutamate gamma-semialdehyde dehydrogenase PutA [Wolbachia pipientis]